MRFQIGTHLFERADDPSFEIKRVKPVEEEKVRDKLVVGEAPEGAFAVLRFGDCLHHAGETFAVKVEEDAHDLGRLRSRAWVFEGFDLFEQSLHPGDPLSQFLIL